MLKFELSEQHVNVIGAALGKAPYEIAAPVIAELQKQVNAQQQPAGPVEVTGGASEAA